MKLEYCGSLASACDDAPRSPPDGMRLITIKGTEDQLTAAKQLIQTKVEEEEAMQRRIELSASHRAPRHKHKPADDSKAQVGRAGAGRADAGSSLPAGCERDVVTVAGRSV